MIQDGDSIIAAVRSSALRYGSKPCLVTPERTLSYEEFHAQIIAVADHLSRLGIRAGDRVAILDVDTIENIVSLYALSALQAIAVPINYRQRVGEVEYQIRNSGARLLLVAPRYAETMGPLREHLALGCFPITAFVEEALAQGLVSREFLAVDSRSPFLICYTSGTTGRPKGAVLEQRVLWLRAVKYVIEFGIRDDDIVHAAFPMFHIGGLVYSLTTIMRGATLLILPQFSLDATMRHVRQHKVTFLATVPTMLAMMAASQDFSPEYFGNVRLIMYGGSPMNTVVLRTIMGTYRGDMVQSFGQTEDLPQTLLSPAAHREALRTNSKRLSALGRPPIGVELRICNEEGRPLPVGEIGEIATRSGTNMTCYWERPDETAKTLKDGWLFSGDLGYQDEDGYVYYAGRKKQMIIRGGENVYPMEVESVISQLDGIADCVVIGLPDPLWGEIVAAVVVVKAGSRLSPDDIIRHCKKHLASYRCPEKVFIHDDLPFNAIGKVDRQALRQRLDAAPA